MSEISQEPEKLAPKKNHNHQDIKEHLWWTRASYDTVTDEIDQLLNSGLSIAPSGCWVVRYLVEGSGGGKIRGANGKCYYAYYKLTSKEKIFKDRRGEPCSYQHLGKAGSRDFLEAVAAVGRRSQLEVLQREQKILEQALLDLSQECGWNCSSIEEVLLQFVVKGISLQFAN